MNASAYDVKCGPARGPLKYMSRSREMNEVVNLNAFSLNTVVNQELVWTNLDIERTIGTFGSTINPSPIGDRAPGFASINRFESAADQKEPTLGSVIETPAYCTGNVRLVPLPVRTPIFKRPVPESACEKRSAVQLPRGA